MGENLIDVLSKLVDILHGLGKYHESNVITDLLILFRQRGVDTVDRLKGKLVPPCADDELGDLFGELAEPDPLPAREKVETAGELKQLDFVLWLHRDEFTAWADGIRRKILEVNKERPHNPFNWIPVTGKDIYSDLRSLIYKIPDAKKQRILYEAYNTLNEKLNWPRYVELWIELAIRSSAKTRIVSPYRWILVQIHIPLRVISARADGILANQEH